MSRSAGSTPLRGESVFARKLRHMEGGSPPSMSNLESQPRASLEARVARAQELLLRRVAELEMEAATYSNIQRPAPVPNVGGIQGTI